MGQAGKPAPVCADHHPTGPPRCSNGRNTRNMPGEPVGMTEDLRLPMPPRNIIMTFTRVVLYDPDTRTKIEFQIVPDDQADIPNDRYPESAPICQAVIGKVLGEAVDTVTLDGQPLSAQIRGVGVGDGQ